MRLSPLKAMVLGSGAVNALLSPVIKKKASTELKLCALKYSQAQQAGGGLFPSSRRFRCQYGPEHTHGRARV